MNNLVKSGLNCLLLAVVGSLNPSQAADDGSVLPFPTTPTASVAAPAFKDSVMTRRQSPSHLSDDAPNIVIIMLDDVGFGQAGTYGGAVNTPTLDRITKNGISYMRFHTTALCSPTRAALLTGRNHHRVGNGAITEMATDFEGYVGTIPRSAATLPKILKEYGYNTSAFGKWHNTPAIETTTMGPFTNWPTGPVIGFDYFYGFLAGETSQWEPRLVENQNLVEPPHDDPNYHLSVDMATKAVSWLRQHRSFSPDKPFFLYFAPGAAHGPHHVAKEWADKYKGKFDGGWDQLSDYVFQRQKALGWIPDDSVKTSRPEFIPAWETIQNHNVNSRPVSWRYSPASSSTQTFRVAESWTKSNGRAYSTIRWYFTFLETTVQQQPGKTARSPSYCSKITSRPPSKTSLKLWKSWVD